MNTNVLHRVGVRLLDGTRAWGSVEVRPDRFGIVHYRLVVYPPGLSSFERRWSRVSRGWPLWGPLLWLLCQIVLAQGMSPWPAFGVSTAVSLGTGVVAAALSGEARTRVRVLYATTMAGFDDPSTIGTRDRFVELAGALTEADERLGRGEISVIDHELIWWRIYDELEPHDTPKPS